MLGRGPCGAALALGGALLALQALATDAARPAAAVPDAVPAPPPGVSQSTDVFEVERVLDADGMVERRLVPAGDLVVGDELRYVIRLRNEGPSRIEPGRIQVRIQVPDGVRFLPGSAGGAGALVEYAPDGLTFSAHLPDQPAVSDIAATDTGTARPESTPHAPDVPETPTAGAAADAPSAEAGRPVDVDAGAGVDASGSVVPALLSAPSASGAPVSGPAAAGMETPPAGIAQALTIRWTYQQPLDPGAATEVFFHVRLL
jgi:uncharacterized repeat protein (TIGR01451 family)